MNGQRACGHFFVQKHLISKGIHRKYNIACSGTYMSVNISKSLIRCICNKKTRVWGRSRALPRAHCCFLFLRKAFLNSENSNCDPNSHLPTPIPTETLAQIFWQMVFKDAAHVDEQTLLQAPTTPCWLQTSTQVVEQHLAKSETQTLTQLFEAVELIS
uniref:Uncharacterized protein n=1 Tax=Romanomermis culicivorax TaxID=13658 RepID=A0A915JXZ9_ROMCU